MSVRIRGSDISVIYLLGLLFLGLAGLQAVQPAWAEMSEQSCGTDLMAGLEQRDPEKYARIRAAADAVPNGRGLLWRIEREGVKVSWLFGTMHLSDGRILDIPRPVADAFETAETLAIETTGILEPAEVMKAVAGNPDLTMLPPGKTLDDYLSEGERAELRDWLKEKGMPYQTVIRMRPWLILSMAGEASCETGRRIRGEKVLDVVLAERARESGKRVVGLETISEQFEALDSFPLETQVRVLLSTAALDESTDDMMETLVGLYLRGETGMFTEALLQLVPHDPQDLEDFTRFENRIVRMRNHVMAERAQEHLERGGAFIAVGALHLPGEEGVVELLRQAGWRVKPASE